MSQISFKNFGLQYADAEHPILNNINLSIEAGQCVLLRGCSGSGKSSLLRAMNGLVPNFYAADLHGELLLDGQRIDDICEKTLYRKIATVEQNPRSQFFTQRIGSELVFSAENFAVDPVRIADLLCQTLSHFQLIGSEHLALDSLSSGEKQRVACASASLLQPEIILLDEPSANLDTKATCMLAHAIQFWKTHGMTVVIAEHRCRYLQGLVDVQVDLANGTIARIYDMPELETPNVQSLDVSAQFMLRDDLRTFPKSQPNLSERHIASPWHLLARFSWFVSCETAVATQVIAQGEVVGVIGENGAGKTSLFRQLCGLAKGWLQLAQNGKRLNRRELRQSCFFVDQEVNRQLLCDSVLDEVMLNMSKPDAQSALAILKRLDIEALYEAHPLNLSGGQKQRVALATAIAANRRFTILDEPTSGLDANNVERVIHEIQRMKARGCTLVLISHDPDFLLRCCDSMMEIESRKIVRHYPLDNEGIVTFRLRMQPSMHNSLDFE